MEQDILRCHMTLLTCVLNKIRGSRPLRGHRGHAPGVGGGTPAHAGVSLQLATTHKVTAVYWCHCIVRGCRGLWRCGGVALQHTGKHCNERSGFYSVFECARCDYIISSHLCSARDMSRSTHARTFVNNCLSIYCCTIKHFCVT